MQKFFRQPESPSEQMASGSIGGIMILLVKIMIVLGLFWAVYVLLRGGR